MSIAEFMTEHLTTIRKDIIIEIPNKEFDSHEFIRHFIKRFEREYVQFLYSYKTEPFRKVHAQIGKFLAEHKEELDIKSLKDTVSENIFGIPSSNEKWKKIKPTT